MARHYNNCKDCPRVYHLVDSTIFSGTANCITSYDMTSLGMSGALSGCLSECNAQSLCGGFWVDRGPPIGVTTTSTTTTSTTTTTTTTTAPDFFVVNDMNQDCPSGQNITDESDCLSAAPEFGFCRGTTLSNQSWRRGCFLHPVSCKVYFNRDTHPDPDGKSYAICKGSGGTTTTETGQI